MRILIPIGGGFCLSQGFILIVGAQTKATPWMTLIGAVMVLAGHFGGLFEDRKRYQDLLAKLKNQGPVDIQLEVKDG